MHDSDQLGRKDSAFYCGGWLHYRHHEEGWEEERGEVSVWWEGVLEGRRRCTCLGR